MGHIGGAACSGEAEGHRSVQLHTSTHERTDAELQNPSCSATGRMHESERGKKAQIYLIFHRIKNTSFTVYAYFFYFQVEFHPKLCQTELRSVCEEYGVCFQAFSSLGTGELVTDPVVMEVAKSCERTPAQVNTEQSILINVLLAQLHLLCAKQKTFWAQILKSVVPLQVLLRWAVQQGVPVIPKSSNPDRMKDNARLFDFTLSDTDMDRLSDLDCGHMYDHDPSEVVWKTSCGANTSLWS